MEISLFAARKDGVFGWKRVLACSDGVFLCAKLPTL